MNKIEGVPFHGVLPQKHVTPRRRQGNALMSLAGSAAKTTVFGLAGVAAEKLLAGAVSSMAGPAALGAVGGLTRVAALGSSRRRAVAGSIASFRERYQSALIQNAHRAATGRRGPGA